MTTQWQSMFDGGACDIEVWDAALRWSGPLGKGDTSPSFDTGDNAGCTIAVDADGVVTLACATGDEPANMAVYVYPQYDTSTLHTRMAAISAWRFGEPQDYTGSAQCDDSAQNVPINFGTSPATPPSAEFAPHAADPDGAFVAVIYPTIG